MRKMLVGVSLITLLALTTASPALAANPKAGWDFSYSLGPTEFCGFSVDVHDFGWNITTKDSDGGLSWAKAWQGTRDYVNPANDATAQMTWAWYTTQVLLDRTETTADVSITTHGSVRVSAPSGQVVAFDAGQLTYDEHLLLVGEDWTWNGDDSFAAKGPHPMDLGDAFCVAMTDLLNS